MKKQFILGMNSFKRDREEIGHASYYLHGYNIIIMIIVAIDMHCDCKVNIQVLN